MSIIKPFFIDASVLAVTRADGNRRKLWMQQLLLLWNSSRVTSDYRITSIDTIENIVQTGPQDYLESRLDRKKGEIVSLPETFGDIVRYASELRNKSFGDFILKDGAIEFAPRFYYKQINRVFFFVVSQEQKKRLAYAETLAKQIEKQREFFAEDCQAVGLTREPFRYSPVPTGVRLDNGTGTMRPVVDHKWVTHGYASTSHSIEQALRTHTPQPFGNYRIAYSENDMVLLDGDSAPKGYTVLPGHYEFTAHICRPGKSKFERVLTSIQ